MTKAEFKAANPSAYNEIVAEGVAQERDRAGAWMAHVETDAAAVKAGVESGEQLTATQREEFFVKQNAKKTTQELKDGSAGDLNTAESITDAKKLEQQEKEKEVKAAFDFELN